MYAIIWLFFSNFATQKQETMRKLTILFALLIALTAVGETASVQPSIINIRRLREPR